MTGNSFIHVVSCYEIKRRWTDELDWAYCIDANDLLPGGGTKKMSIGKDYDNPDTWVAPIVLVRL